MGENLVNEQASRAQFHGSPSSLKRIFRMKSSESFENRVPAIGIRICMRNDGTKRTENDIEFGYFRGF
ncbi:hypothetical protein ACFX19_031884 [Malus domestica]